MIKIRNAAAADLDGVVKLYQQVCAYLEDQPFSPGWSADGYPSREDLSGFIQNGEMYVAEMAGKIVGGIALTPESGGNPESPEDKGEMYLRVFAVHPDHMREGIGTALLQYTEQMSARRGAPALHLYVYEKDTVAIRVYEGNGFVFRQRVDLGLKEYGLNWFYLYEKSLPPFNYMAAHQKSAGFYIRACRIDDTDVIYELNRDALGYHFPIEATKEKIYGALKSCRTFIAVAVCGNRVIGYIHAVDYDVLYAPPMKDILALAVNEEYRRLGVGHALLQAVETWAMESGAAGIRLVSGSYRIGAHEFYKKCGYICSKEQYNFKKLIL